MACEAIEVLPPADQECITAIKRALLDDIRPRIRQLFVTQQRAADALGMRQPHVAELMAGKIERFSINWLVMTATRLGLNIEIETTPCA